MRRQPAMKGGRVTPGLAHRTECDGRGCQPGRCGSRVLSGTVEEQAACQSGGVGRSLSNCAKWLWSPSHANLRGGSAPASTRRQVTQNASTGRSVAGWPRCERAWCRSSRRSGGPRRRPTRRRPPRRRAARATRCAGSRSRRRERRGSRRLRTEARSRRGPADRPARSKPAGSSPAARPGAAPARPATASARRSPESSVAPSQQTKLTSTGSPVALAARAAAHASRRLLCVSHRIASTPASARFAQCSACSLARAASSGTRSGR